MDGVTGIRFTNGGIPIADVDYKFFAQKGDFVPGNTEDYIEGFANDLFSAATHYTEDPLSCGWKVFHSDGFHMSKYFTILTEHKRCTLTTLKLTEAICQALYYYWYSLKVHKNNDNLKYICICDSNSIYSIKISDIKNTCDNVFKCLNQLDRCGALQGKGKITASNCYKVSDIFKEVDSITNYDIIHKSEYKDFSDNILWMFNEWENGNNN